MSKEPFEILKVYTIKTKYQNTTYCEYSCREGHIMHTPLYQFSKRWYCSGCSSKYRKLPEYNIVDGMKQRCSNPKNCRYEKYGGRGITVCDRWSEYGYLGVKNFIEDMGNKPEGFTLDRIDVNGNYEPSNCRWADPKMQSFNKNLFVTNTSGYTGVMWRKERSKWVATIGVNDKTIKLGSFDEYEDAVKARIEGEIKYYGETRLKYELHEF